MNRREFLLLSSSALILSGCDSQYFQASPYEITTEDSGLTHGNIYEIENRSQQRNSSFTFTVVSDTHIFYDDFSKVQKAIKAKASDYSFLVHGGDLTDSGLKWEFEQSDKILREAGLPYLTVIGNHDALTNGRGIYSNLYGPYDYSVEFNGAKLIFFNNNSWEFGYGIPYYDWLESQLASANADQPIIIICHIPPLQSERFSEIQITKFKELVKNYSVDFVINGHNHGHSFKVVEGVTYLTNGSVSNLMYCEISVTYNEEGGHSVDFTPIYL